jgi:putative intracellular protease/amidase
VDQGSLTADANGGQENADRIARTLASMTELKNLIPLDAVDLDDYAAVYYPGGHGPMEDLAVDRTSGRLLTDALASGKPLAVVCHSPAALLAATDDDGVNAFADYRVTAFTNAEETQAGLADKAAWLLETRLTEAGLDVRTAEPWAPHVIVDRNLYTGQNPSSSAPLAAEIVKKLA